MSTSRQTQTTGFAKIAKEKADKENIWQAYNAEAKYDGKNISKSIRTLADAIFPDQAKNSTAYQEAILINLIDTLSPEIGINDFWKSIGKDGCKLLKIENGHLNFYITDKKRLDITKYTQPIVFEAESSLYKLRREEREKRLKEAHRQLNELLSEIKKK